MSIRKTTVVLGFLLLAVACAEEVPNTVSALPPADEAGQSSPDYFTIEAAKTVGGCECATWVSGVKCSEISYSDRPADNRYYVTTFGGAGDGQDMWICGHKTCDNGTWPYVAGYARFGCSKVKIVNPNTGKYCIGEVADCGPNVCVEEAACYCGCAAHIPILDVSPYITQALFGISGSGYSDKRIVEAWVVDSTTPNGCSDGPVVPDKGTLIGVVYEGGDKAARISGATVKLNTGASLVTDSTGYFEFSLVPGTYTATATKAGFLPGSQTRTVSSGAEIWGSISLSKCACDDGNPCTDDTCDPNTGCKNTSNSAACNDNNDCTANDRCSGGKCSGDDTGGSCNDGIECTADKCVAGGGCSYLPVDESCDDGVPCTVDVCDALKGCVNTPDPAGCDDGIDCTLDTCDLVKGCVFIPDDELCGADGGCALWRCDLTLGCVKEGGSTSECSDGNPCTVGDKCVGGACVPGGLMDCDDGNVCTDDYCRPADGQCFTLPNHDDCDDGDPCTRTECSGGQCVVYQTLPQCEGKPDYIGPDVIDAVNSADGPAASDSADDAGDILVFKTNSKRSSCAVSGQSSGCGEGLWLLTLVLAVSLMGVRGVGRRNGQKVGQ